MLVDMVKKVKQIVIVLDLVIQVHLVTLVQMNVALIVMVVELHLLRAHHVNLEATPRTVWRACGASRVRTIPTAIQALLANTVQLDASQAQLEPFLNAEHAQRAHLATRLG